MTALALRLAGFRILLHRWRLRRKLAEPQTVCWPVVPQLRPMNRRTFADPRFCRDAQQSKVIAEGMIREMLKRVERREIAEPEGVLARLYEWRDRCGESCREWRAQ